MVGGLALAGIPPFAGFFSKDEILAKAFEASPLLWVVGIITAGLTAYYTFRVWFRVCAGAPHYEMGEEHHDDHGEEDAGVHPAIGEYVCGRIPSCTEPPIYPGEGHSVMYYRYEEIIQAMLEAWK